MNREKLIAKIIKNKHEQARDEYAKNKPMLVESELKEKAEHYEEQVDSEFAKKEEEAKKDEQSEKEEEASNA